MGNTSSDSEKVTPTSKPVSCNKVTGFNYKSGEQTLYTYSSGSSSTKSNVRAAQASTSRTGTIVSQLELKSKNFQQPVRGKSVPSQSSAQSSVAPHQASALQAISLPSRQTLDTQKILSSKCPVARTGVYVNSNLHPKAAGASSESHPKIVTVKLPSQNESRPEIAEKKANIGLKSQIIQENVGKHSKSQSAAKKCAESGSSGTPNSTYHRVQGKAGFIQTVQPPPHHNFPGKYKAQTPDQPAKPSAVSHDIASRETNKIQSFSKPFPASKFSTTSRLGPKDKHHHEAAAGSSLFRYERQTQEGGASVRRGFYDNTSPKDSALEIQGSENEALNYHTRHITSNNPMVGNFQNSRRTVQTTSTSINKGADKTNFCGTTCSPCLPEAGSSVPGFRGPYHRGNVINIPAKCTGLSYQHDSVSSRNGSDFPKPSTENFSHSRPQNTIQAVDMRPVALTPESSGRGAKNKRRHGHRKQQAHQQAKREKAWWKRKKVQPDQCLLFFSRGEQAEVCVSSDESDTDSLSVMSQHSSSVLTEDSEDEQESIFSTGSQSEVISNWSITAESQSSHSNADVVGVFWDANGCCFPPGKAFSDIVKKVREQYCKVNMELSFTVLCDIHNLNSVPTDQLEECGVLLLHCTGESVSDKLYICIADLCSKVKTKIPFVVLITEGSRAGYIFHRGAFTAKHSVLIFSGTVDENLRSSFWQCIPFSNFVSDLPNCPVAENVQHYLTLSNLPPYVKWKNIKKILLGTVNHSCSQIRPTSSTSAEIAFPNEHFCKKAFDCLQGLALYGCPIQVEFKAETKNKKAKQAGTNVKDETCDAAKSHQVMGKNRGQSHTKPQVSNSLEVHKKNDKDDSHYCEATLHVVVSHRTGDVSYWERQFKILFRNEDLSAEWSGQNSDGYFLVMFKSINSARKAKKVLLNLQKENSSAPRFLKLVKGGKSVIGFDVDRLRTYDSCVEAGRAIIQQHVKYLTARMRQCLEQHDRTVREATESHTSLNRGTKKNFDAGVSSARTSKLQELCEMRITFEEFSESTQRKLLEIDVRAENFNQQAEDILKDYSRECSCFQACLPVYAKKNAIVKTVRNHQVVVIQAETGSGKSTQVCQYLWREGLANSGMIVCTQPRKIAAVSLAKHVSTQVGCCVGGIVGYQVGMSQRKSPQTKILYATDFTLLKLCTKDPFFSEFSCIVVDEAHERSIYTDLLLGMIKRCLPSRPDLKIVITSATIKVSLFQDYFRLPRDATMKISGRSFPIEDVWLDKDVELGWNYFEKTVNTAFNILAEEPGDVLAFLPTPAETEKAVNVFNEKAKNRKHTLTLLVYSLHGKQDLKEQQKIFEKTPHNCRKIVFSTNCAETSVTIPGIKYVVDSGMVKEARYDAVRNLNVLSVGFVNKSSAEQRRGRAGRIESGKCYRLYSHTNYEKDMANQMVPEILRVNLGQALLKLMVCGIEQPLQFDFVESPPREALVAAMKQLIHLGAVSHDGRAITASGQSMAVLPLEPRLSHIILKGRDINLGYEAVVLSALATVSRSIFFRNAENKAEADLKKVRFCLSESDFLTYLEVYKEWLDVPKTEKSRWCTINCINAKSMRLAHELVTEVLETMSKELGIKLSSRFSDKMDALVKLHRIIFRSFSENLCIYSGHEKIGYLSANVQGSLHIHPSSSLYSLGKWRPEFVVYDSILRTSQTFVVNITAVEDDMLKESMQSNELPVSPESLRRLLPTPYVLTHLGPEVLKNFIGVKGAKMRIIEEQLREITNWEHCVIDANFDKGSLSVFAPAEFHAVVEQFLLPLVQGIQSNLVEEEREVKNFAGVELLSAVCGSGVEVKEIILPNEYRSVKITPPDCDMRIAMECLKKFGNITSTKDFERYKKVTFQRAEYAQRAVENLRNENRFTVIPVAARWPSKCTPSSFKLVIELLRRRCNGLAFFSVNPASAFPEVSYCLCAKVLYFQGSREEKLLKIGISKKVQDDFCIRNLPSDVTEEKLRSFLNGYLTAASVNKLVIIREKEFVNTKADVESMKENLMSLLKTFTTEEKLEVHVQIPNPKAIFWKIFVTFSDPYAGQKAYNYFKTSSHTAHLSNLPVVALKPIVETTLFCNKDVFTAIRGQIDEALEFFNKGALTEDTLTVKVTEEDSGQKVCIFLSSNSIQNIFDASRSIRSFVEGDKIDCKGNALLEKLLTEKGKQFLKELKSKVSTAHIYFNAYSKVICIYGSDAACTVMKHEINNFLDSLAKSCSEEISLMSGSKSILKELMRRYDTSLEKLRTLCGLASIEVNVRRKTLFVSGKQANILKCRELVAEILKELGTPDTEGDENEECPVCLDVVASPSYRLEYCGHKYCEMCIFLQFQNLETMPVACCQENCGKPLVLKDLKNILQRSRIQEKKIYSKSLESFVNKNSASIKFCPTPDCQMLFRVTSDEKQSEYVCPSCSNRICRKCCVLYHFGMTCAYYQMYRNVDDDALKAWMKQDPQNRKLCPSCKSPIMKDGGCLHVHCWNCKCHMCWRCLQKFPTGNDVYGHQASCPAVMR